MADILINSVIDRPAIEGEVSYVAAKIKEIELLISQAKTGGVKIMGAQSFKEFDAAQKELAQTQKELAIATKQAEQAAIASARAKKAEADAARALAQQQIAETRLREANAKAAEREAKAANGASSSKKKGALTDAEMKAYVEGVPFTANVAADGTIIDPGISENLDETADRLNDVEREYAEAANEATAFGAASKKAADDSAKSTKQAEAPISKYKDNLEELTGTLDENQELQAIYRQELQEISSELKLLDKTTDSAGKTTEEYQKKVAELLGRHNALKKESSELTQTIKNQVKEQNNAAGSVDALRARLNLATQAYDKLSETQRTSPMGKFLKTEIVALTSQVSTAEQSIGKFQRNVGNYVKGIGTAFANGASKIFGYVRTIANILPGVGISGIFLAIGTGIAAMIRAITGADEATQKLQSSLSNLSKQAETAKAAIENLNNQLDFYNKLVQLSNDIRISDDFERSLADLSAELSFTIDKWAELDEQIIKLKTNLSGIKSEALKNLGGDDFLSFTEAITGSNDSLDNLSDGIKKSAQDYIKTEKIISDLEKERESANQKLVILRRTREAITAKEERKNAEKRKSDAEKYAEAERKASLELFKFQQGLLIQKAKDDIAFNSGDRQIEARKRLFELEKQLAEGIARYERQQKDLTKSQLLLIDRKLIEGIKENRIQLNIDLAEIRQKEIQDALNQADQQAKELQAAEEKANAERTQNSINSLENQLEARLGLIERSAESELLAQAELYAKGEISKEKYEQEKHRIENESLQKSIQLQIEYYKQLAFLSGISTEEQKKYIDKLNKLYSDLKKSKIKNAEEGKDKELEIEREKNEALKSLAREVAGLTFDFFTAGIERQRNAVQDLIDDLERQKQKDIEVANQTITNATERANAIAVIEARAAAQREQLERRQRQLQVQRARFERAEQVANIIGNTAAAVAKALPNIPLSILVGAIGAAQLVRVLATPIPRYAEGTDNHPGGWAMLGDGGRSEVFVTPSGKTGVSGDSPEYHNLERGTVVYPSIQDYAAAMHTPLPVFGQQTGTDMMPVVMAVNSTARRMEKAIKKIPQPIITTDGNWSRMRRGQSSTQQWLNRNF